MLSPKIYDYYTISSGTGKNTQRVTNMQNVYKQIYDLY